MPAHDPILMARLDALRLLADRVPDRAMVLTSDFHILYDNRSSSKGGAGLQACSAPMTCYGQVLQRTQPCEACPATEVFRSGQALTIPRTARVETHSCGIRKVMPLLSSEGHTASVLVLLDILAGQGRRQLPDAQKDRLGTLIGRSATMQHLFQTIQLVAPSDAAVLLHGESGTGKELVARTIHGLSPRHEQPFVVVDCATLPETLLESELFGHVKGAFTGAVRNKTGLFQEANHGTLFLDEVAETTQPFQARLLRVIQEGEIKPVGSNRTVPVDVRVISASNKDLLQLVHASVFRPDLYYRLAVLPIVVPPLRDRREDIPLLVEHFLASACHRHRRPMATVTTEAMAALVVAAWPGNIRQLKHAVERAVVTAPQRPLDPDDFFGSVVPAQKTDLRTSAQYAAQAAERARIVEALQEASGNKSRAARVLKTSRANLYNKLRACGIEPSESGAE